jgi:predicted deacylase
MPDLQLISRTFRGAAGPHLLITAGVHGDEFEPMSAVRALMSIMASQKLRGTVVLVPLVNAAAFDRGDRTAEDGLDLARVCPGRPDGSITERTADALSRMIRAADFFIDLHTGGKAFALTPLAGYMMHSDPAVLQSQRRMARAFNLPLVWGTTASLNGRSLSVARDANVPAIYVEHGGGTAFNASAVTDLTDGCLNVMTDLEMISRAAPESRIWSTVEDRSEHSGHLQINYPSPIDGVFEPEVNLGRWMQRGDVIGRLSDPKTGQTVGIHAEETGMVVMLRAAPRVRRDDALAAIVPMPATPVGGSDAQ